MLFRAVFCLVLQAISAFCGDTIIPQDPKVIRGQFSNGLTYYIRENSYPEKNAILRLVVKAGSIHENDDEKGIAHFIEHLVFRGTEHFNEKEIDWYCNSIRYNASTYFENTLYEFDLSLAKKNSLEPAFAILSDFAIGATLSDEAIEKERNVVLDELHRRHSSADYRFRNEILNIFVEKAPHLGHFPIGLKEVIQTVSPDQLRNFYKKWYRPDRMAVIAVGDFDSQDVQRMLESSFSILPSCKETLETLSAIQLAKNPRALVYSDPELSMTTVQLVSCFPLINSESFTEKDIRNSLLSSASVWLLQNRLSKREHDQAEFFNAEVYKGDSFFSSSIGELAIGGSLFEDCWKEGIQALYQESQQTLKTGFIAMDLAKFQVYYRLDNENQLANFDKRSHETYARQYIEHFLYGAPYVDRRQILEHKRTLIDSLTLEEINSYLATSHLADQFSVLLTTPSQSIQTSINEHSLLGLLENSSTLTYSSEKLDADVKFQVNPNLPPGKITMVIEDPHSQVIRWTLSNGIQLSLKQTDLECDQVYLLALASSGLNAVSEEEFPSALLSIPYTRLSGMQGLSRTEFSDLLQSKHMDLFRDWDNSTRQVGLYVGKHQIETAFQLIYSFFTNPFFDSRSWKMLINQQKELRKQKANNPDTLFERFLSKINTQDHFYFRPIDLEQSQENLAQRLIKDHFGRPQDFSFIVVGDFDQVELIQLTEKYLGSFPISEIQPSTKNVFPEMFPKKVIYEEFRAGHKSYATTVMTAPINSRQVFEKYRSFCSSNAVIEILNRRLTDVLRTQLGNTYGVQISEQSPFGHYLNNTTIKINFTSQPEHSKEMAGLVWKELKRIQIEPCSPEELEAVQALFREEKKKDAFSNQYWIGAISWSQLFNLPLKEVLAYEDRISKLSLKDIQETAQMMFSSPYRSTIVHLPETL